MQVKRENIIPIDQCLHKDQHFEEFYTEHEGLQRQQLFLIPAFSDVPGYSLTRFSQDNGRTWSEIETLDSEPCIKIGEDEMFIFHYGRKVWNPVNNHYFLGMSHRLNHGNAAAANLSMWRGQSKFIHHSFVEISFPDGRKKLQMLRFEDGPAYTEDGYDYDYSSQNECSCWNTALMENGDILLALCVPMEKVCAMLGEDIEEYDPTRRHDGLMIARGHWNAEKEEYDFTYSRPMQISTWFSSRGICEPQVVELKSGRILIVFRGSNLIYPRWNTRIEPHMPGFKWYMFSDDGGKTFTQPMPWHFDNREVMYSSSTLCLFIRSKKNGNLYWVGNVSDHTAYENFPRYPLHICQVDDTWGVPIKDTLTVIDTRQEDESEKIQLSNFCLLDDRETGNIEVFLTKVGKKDSNDHKGTWKYTIEL